MIETIVFDLGGVLMNHNMPGCIAKFKQLLGDNFPILGLKDNGEAASSPMSEEEQRRLTVALSNTVNTSSIMHEYEVGGASTDDFVAALLPYCQEGTTREDILDAWNTMHGGIPAERLEIVYELHKRYPVYLLSNNNEEHWRDVMARYFSPDKHEENSPYNLHPVSSYFDGLFLSHLMHLGKPDEQIFQKADEAIALHWAEQRPNTPYSKSNTVFVDDLAANREAAEDFGWQACASLDDLQAMLEGYISAREKRVVDYLHEHAIPFTNYTHPEGKTIEEAKRWWHDDGSVHCKNLFFRNHKGNVHYLVCFDCDHDLAIHDLEHRLKASLQAAGLPSPGKLSFASPERMMRYLGLEPGSVSPFGLINDRQHEVILFLDKNLLHASSLSFHPNDCRGTVVISHEAFNEYLKSVGNKVEYLELY